MAGELCSVVVGNDGVVCFCGTNCADGTPEWPNGLGSFERTTFCVRELWALMCAVCGSRRTDVVCVVVVVLVYEMSGVVVTVGLTETVVLGETWLGCLWE